MKAIMVYSEAGGVTKTTTAVSIARLAAEAGHRAVLLDLDPRAASTRWTGVAPKEEGWHVGAVLAADEPVGWAEELAVQSGWHENLRVIPSARSVSNRESERTADHAYLRLKQGMIGLEADVVVIDSPNRQGGPLIQAGLTAADGVVYAATPTSDGVDGFVGARATVRAYMRSRELLMAPADLKELGIVVGDYQSTVTPRAQTVSVDELRETGLLRTPLVPRRSIVQESRNASVWYGDYTKGEPVVSAYQDLTTQILKEMQS